MLRLWCLVYLQILIGDFQKGKIHVCSLKETKVIKGQSLQPPKKFATWSENRLKTVDSLANLVSSGGPGSIAQSLRVYIFETGQVTEMYFIFLEASNLYLFKYQAPKDVTAP